MPSIRRIVKFISQLGLTVGIAICTAIGICSVYQHLQYRKISSSAHNFHLNDYIHLNKPNHHYNCSNLKSKSDGLFNISYENVTMEQLRLKYEAYLVEDKLAPANCTAHSRVAIIVSYRNRSQSLLEFLNNLPEFLLKQSTEFAIFVIEPIENQTFNRAKLLNIGFEVASTDSIWNCFVFHDVDLLPENLHNYYKCRDTPVHLASALNIANYRLPYPENFGGVSMFTRDQFWKINGFSNDYWGYAGEDDDSYASNSLRVYLVGSSVWRYPSSIAHYKMKRHAREQNNPLNPCRYELIKKVSKRFHKDGLNSLNYNLVRLEHRTLYHWYLVDLLETEGKRKMEEENLCKEPPITI